MKIINVLLVYFLIINFSFANDIDENKNIYQVQFILVSHAKSNYLDKISDFISDPYNNIKKIKIKNNNCIIDKSNLCVKYEKDYKLENFNKYIEIIDKDSGLKVISHKEWVQNMDSIYNIKIKGGYDYSEDIFNENLEILDFNILSEGAINKFDGHISIRKNKFFKIHLNILERLKMKQDGFFSSDALVSKEHNIIQNIKLNKTTYIDRDNFGVIIKVKKIKNI